MATLIVGALCLIVALGIAAVAWWSHYMESIEARLAAQGEVKAEGSRRAKIGRWIWTACMDDQTCAQCREIDGREWKRRKDALNPPLADCGSAEGCRCQLVGVYDDEGKVILEP